MKPDSAENNFRLAFERLKSGSPIRLQSGASVTQNNVAREAGRDPSALKKARYPLLVEEIKCYVSSVEELSHVKRRPKNRKRSYRKLISNLKDQRDFLQSKVYAQEVLIDELLEEISVLKGRNIKSL